MNEQPDLIDELQFTCPRCGSHHYGSWGYPPDLERSCHGYLPSGEPCRFEWHENFDRLVMKPTGRKHPRVQILQLVVGTATEVHLAAPKAPSTSPEFLIPNMDHLKWRVFYVDGGVETVVGILFADSLQHALEKGVARCREVGFSLAGIKLQARRLTPSETAT